MCQYNLDKIQKIKDQNLFGSIIEVGAGCPVYNELCSYPNTASKIVLFASSPNNWEYNKYQYNYSDNVRAVSFETLKRIIGKTYYDLCEMKSFEHTGNHFILANTIQVANTPETQTHGWFALHTTDVYFYHFSINGFKSRKEYAAIIAQIGLDILASANDLTKLDSGYIDIILDKNGNQLLKETVSTLLTCKLNISNIHNSTIVIDKSGKLIRLNDLLRNVKDNLVIFKGSFNPIHEHHLDLIDIVTKEIKDSTPVFLISISNRDINKKVDIDSLLKRIKLLNSLGYSVMLDCFGLYHYSYTYLNENSDIKNITLNYIMGGDITNRFLTDENVLSNDKESIRKFNSKWNCNFYYCYRPEHYFKIPKQITNFKYISVKESEISSTMIRNLISDGNYEKLKSIVNNTQLYNNYLDIYAK